MLETTITVIILATFSPLMSTEKALEGSWTLDHLEKGGQTMPRGSDGRFHYHFFAFSRNKFWFTVVSGSNGTLFHGTYRLRQTEDVNVIEFRHVLDNNKSIQGIYQLEGDTLHLYVPLDNKSCPSGFTDDLIVEVWKRDENHSPSPGYHRLFTVAKFFGFSYKITNRTEPTRDPDETDGC